MGIVSYILKGHEVVEEPDLQRWITWRLATPFSDMSVGQDQIGPYAVSTIFLCLNLAGGTDRPPHVFETAIFDNQGEVIICGRCSTWEQAEEQHKRVCEEYRKKVDVKN